jgi:hypothetical protein
MYVVIFFSKNVLAYNISPNLESTFNYSNYVEFQDGELLKTIQDVFTKNEIKAGSRIYYILDHCWINPRFFNFPIMKRSDVKQILEFEIASTLTGEKQEYLFDFNQRKNSQGTHITAFCIEQVVSALLYEESYKRKLEVRSVSSWINLVDLNHRKDNSSFTANHIYLHLTKFGVYILTYSDSCLIDVSCRSLTEHDDPYEFPYCFTTFIRQLLRSIQIVHRTIRDIKLNDFAECYFYIENNILYPLEQTGESIDNGINTIEIHVKSKEKINLSGSHSKLLEGLKKNKKKGLYLAYLLGCLCLLYLFNMGLTIVNVRDKLGSLNTEYNSLLQKNLPKGTSKANASYILQEKVTKLRKEYHRKNEFSIRKYSVSSFLVNISSIKNESKSVQFHYMEYGDKHITIKGTLGTRKEFSVLKKSINDKFSSKYSIKISQKRGRNDSLQFSVYLRNI